MVVVVGGCVLVCALKSHRNVVYQNTHAHAHAHAHIHRREPREPTRKSRRLEGQTAPHYNEEKLIMEVRGKGGCVYLCLCLCLHAWKRTVVAHRMSVPKHSLT